MEKLNKIQSISFQDEEMIIEIDELKYNIDLNQVSKKLLHATAEERNKYEISPSNYGIHWSMIDEDLSIERLLKTKI